MFDTEFPPTDPQDKESWEPIQRRERQLFEYFISLCNEAESEGKSLSELGQHLQNVKSKEL